MPKAVTLASLCVSVPLWLDSFPQRYNPAYPRGMIVHGIDQNAPQR